MFFNFIGNFLEFVFAILGGYDFDVKRVSFTRKINKNNTKTKFAPYQNPIAKETNRQLQSMGNIEYAEVTYRHWYYGWWKMWLIFPIAFWWYFKNKKAKIQIKNYLRAGWKPVNEMINQQILVQYLGIPFEWDGTYSLAIDRISEVKQLFKDIKNGYITKAELDDARKKVRKFYKEIENSISKRKKEKLLKEFQQYGI